MCVCACWKGGGGGGREGVCVISMQCFNCLREKVKKNFGSPICPPRSAVSELRLATNLPALQSSSRVKFSSFFFQPYSHETLDYYRDYLAKFQFRDSISGWR